MQQRQLRLGDILDDYCPRERRLTNHAVVAMVGSDVKQTRCTTCDAEHEYKHAKVPRQRRKADTPPALYAQMLAGAPKRVPHDERTADNGEQLHVDDLVTERAPAATSPAEDSEADAIPLVTDTAAEEETESEEQGGTQDRDEGPVHRPLIRASLPRPEGQTPIPRPAPDFTIRQPGRPNRFRPRHQRGGGQSFQGNRSNGNIGGGMRGGPPRLGSGRPPQGSMSPRPGHRHGSGRKRSK